MTAASQVSAHPSITHPLNVLVATDCGSTTTKAILIEKVGEELSPNLSRRSTDHS